MATALLPYATTRPRLTADPQFKAIRDPVHRKI
jgi:hypothetical protein